MLRGIDRRNQHVEAAVHRLAELEVLFLAGGSQSEGVDPGMSAFSEMPQRGVRIRLAPHDVCHEGAQKNAGRIKVSSELGLVIESHLGCSVVGLDNPTVARAAGAVMAPAATSNMRRAA